MFTEIEIEEATTHSIIQCDDSVTMRAFFQPSSCLLRTICLSNQLLLNSDSGGIRNVFFQILIWNFLCILHLRWHLFFLKWNYLMLAKCVTQQLCLTWPWYDNNPFYLLDRLANNNSTHHGFNRFFLSSWRICWGKLPTKVWLSDRDPQMDRKCLLCKFDDEDINHLFFVCLYSRQIWADCVV